MGAAVLCACLLAVSPALAAGAASTFTVTGFGDAASGSCTSPDANGNSVCPTLRAAVNQASLQTNSPTIELSAGIYLLTLGELSTGAFTIQGTGPGGAGGTTIEQADGVDRVIHVIAGPAKLVGLEITDGHLAPASSPACSSEPWAGAGILSEATLVLQNVLVTGNQVVAPAAPSNAAGDCAQGGGVAYTKTVTPGSVISDSVITGNSATGGSGGTGGGAGGAAEGGGIAYLGSGPLIIQNSTISQNQAVGGAGGHAVSSGGSGGGGFGGGIYSSGALTLNGTTVASTAADGGAQGALASGSAAGGPGEGGGLFSQNSNDELVNSTIFSNSAGGGAPASGGTPGQGSGGGIVSSASNTTLQSDTIDANSAGGGGNLELAGGTGAVIHDTVVASGSPDNCAISGAVTSESNNLEDDAAAQCDFSTANHDLVGANPALPSSLAQNGGPTPTLAPAPGSSVLGAGGSCLDPTSTPPNQPLTSDQRGAPRPVPCDIGAFQGQRPANTVRPVLSGTARRGQTLICAQGTWTGDGLLTYGFTWLRDGVPITGTTTNTYVVGPADAGQTLACQVTASYYGSTAAVSPFVIVPSYPVITVLMVTSTSTAITISLGCRGPDLQRCIGQLRTAVVETRRGGRVIALSAPTAGNRGVTLGQHGYSILARHVATIRIALRRRVRLLLAHFRRIPALLTVTQSTAAGTATVSALNLKIRRPKPAGRR